MFYKKRTTKKMWVTCHLIWFFTFIIWLPLMWLYYYFILTSVTSVTSDMVWKNMLVMMGLFIAVILIGIVALIYSWVHALRNKKFKASYQFLWMRWSKKRQVKHYEIASSLDQSYSKRFQTICIVQSIFYQLVFVGMNIHVIATTAMVIVNISSVVVFYMVISLVWIISLILNIAMIHYYRHSEFIHKS